ncbi:hypothetical protein VTP01DRAFT_10443 [Rhizomucor pusillus]|uniref:uncharacterized protein n=1 Tax=Rhizomucor pusillus TaxID=4840 RepID=UPI0037444185
MSKSLKKLKTEDGVTHHGILDCQPVECCGIGTPMPRRICTSLQEKSGRALVAPKPSVDQINLPLRMWDPKGFRFLRKFVLQIHHNKNGYPYQRPILAQFLVAAIQSMDCWSTDLSRKIWYVVLYHRSFPMAGNFALRQSASSEAHQAELCRQQSSISLRRTAWHVYTDQGYLYQCSLLLNDISYCSVHDTLYFRLVLMHEFLHDIQALFQSGLLYRSQQGSIPNHGFVMQQLKLGLIRRYGSVSVVFKPSAIDSLAIQLLRHWPQFDISSIECYVMFLITQIPSARLQA